MGKTTLCNAIMQIRPAHATRLDRLRGPRARRARRPTRSPAPGIGYVPQGRRLFESLTVDEHLRMAAPRRGGHRWTPDAVYELFPRLAERRRNGGMQLSGGEQQMLAIGRALLTNPQAADHGRALRGARADDHRDADRDLPRRWPREGLAILVVEQNLGDGDGDGRAPARDGGRADLRRDDGRRARRPTPSCSAATSASSRCGARADGDRRPRRHARHEGHRVRLPARPRCARPASTCCSSTPASWASRWSSPTSRARRSRAPRGADHAELVARRRPRRRGRRRWARGAAAVLARLHAEGRLDGVAAVGGSGNSSIAAQAMRDLPVGVPKLIVSTVASGDTRPYVGAVDVTMMYSVVDIAGHQPDLGADPRQRRRRDRRAWRRRRCPARGDERPLVGATMFGVTTPCVTRARERLEELGYEVLVFHATGTGGQSMEALATGGFLAGVLDVDDDRAGRRARRRRAVGRARPAGGGGRARAAAGRLARRARHGQLRPARDRARAQFEDRNLYVHNPTVTLMRTTPEEMRRARAGGSPRKLNGADRPDRALRAAARRLGDRRRRASRSTTRRPTRRCSPRCARASTPTASRCTRSTPTSTTRPSPTAMADRLHELIQEAAMTRDEALAAAARAGRRRAADHRRRRRHGAVGQVRRGRRRRPDHHLQLRPLPDGRPRLAGRADALRRRQRDRHGHGARGAAGRRATRRCSPASAAPTRSG